LISICSVRGGFGASEQFPHAVQDQEFVAVDIDLDVISRPDGAHLDQPIDRCGVFVLGEGGLELAVFGIAVAVQLAH